MFFGLLIDAVERKLGMIIFAEPVEVTLPANMKIES